MSARLIPKAGGSPIVIDKPVLLIGRQPNCDIVIQSSSKVSRKHCCFAQVNGRFLVRDLGSMNGVRVNGSRVEECQLQSGDEVAVGDVYFVFKSDVDSKERRADNKNTLGVEVAGQKSDADLNPNSEDEYHIPLPESLSGESNVVHLDNGSDALLIEPESSESKRPRNSDSNSDLAFRRS